MSDAVERDLLSMKPNPKHIRMVHPWYDHFGEKIAKEEAQNQLKLFPNKKTLLFFGLIRDYKGLDLLLRAMADERVQALQVKLIIAGEFYGKREKYDQWLNDPKLKKRIHLADHFIPDEDVHTYFSAADLCVLPYRTATQSGVTATAFHFGVPALVTDVGGLKDAVGNKGMVIPKDDPGKMAYAIDATFQKDVLEQYKREIEAEREQFSWDYFARELVQFANEI
jgi:glycosyltransferase involved in cell wall biosynthesis